MSGWHPRVDGRSRDGVDMFEMHVTSGSSPKGVRIYPGMVQLLEGVVTFQPALAEALRRWERS